MKLLLDTHAFLEFSDGDEAFPSNVRKLIESPENEKHLSIASVWEIAIKLSIGKLQLRLPFVEAISTGLPRTGSRLLGITIQHLETTSRLPFHHRDPFDRLLVAQCLVEGFTLLSNDQTLDAYAIARRWS